MKVKYDEQLMKYLISEVKGKSRNNIKSLLKYKQVFVNGKSVTKFDHQLKVGDEVTISKFRTDDEIEVLFEDEYFVAINKPANFLSVRNNKGEYTAISMILKHLDKSSVNSKVFVLHRLDKATSGVYLVAKSEKIQEIMQNDWNGIVTSRDYYAVVEGFVKSPGRIESNLTENSENIVFSTNGEGKKAITNYKVMFKSNTHSLLDVNIETGRKNQIRVHMKEMGHPVLGDLKYGEKSKLIRRLALHAYKLEFIHPITKLPITIEAPMPNEFKKLSRKL